jgi:hypothetical protein
VVSTIVEKNAFSSDVIVAFGVDRLKLDSSMKDFAVVVPHGVDASGNVSGCLYAV